MEDALHQVAWAIFLGAACIGIGIYMGLGAIAGALSQYKDPKP